MDDTSIHAFKLKVIFFHIIFLKLIVRITCNGVVESLLYCLLSSISCMSNTIIHWL